MRGWFVGAGVVALAASAGITACGGEAGGAACVRIAGSESAGQKLSLDPAVAPSSQNSMLVAAAYDRLLTTDDDFELHPQLATRYEPSQGGRVWTFTLRRGVKFHDGHELTAADVVYTYKRLLDPKTGSAAVATLSFLEPSGITAAGRYKVRFESEQPVAELPLLLTNKNTYVVADGASDDEIKQEGAGTGPFVPTSFQAGQEPYRFERNEDYWREGKPAAGCLEFRAVQEATSRIAALTSGQVDVVERVDFSTAPRLEANREVEVITTKPATSMTLSMWVDEEPFDDPRVRQALKKVVDRKKILDTVLLGYGEAGNDNPIPPSSRYAFTRGVPAQDLAGARRLLAEAGYTSANPLRIRFHTSDFIPGAVNLAQLFKQQAAQAGVQVNVVTGPASEHFDNVWLKQPFVGSGWSARPPAEALSVAYLKSSAENETHWIRPAYERILEEASRTLDEQKRIGLYKDAQRMLAREGGVIVPAFFETVAAVRRNCSGYRPSIQAVQFDWSGVNCR